MEAVQALHMNKGDGETSYAKNSTVQRDYIKDERGDPEAVHGIVGENRGGGGGESGGVGFGIADLGCSSGPNSLKVISEIIDIIHARCQLLGCPEFRVSLNDLPGNDFNSIFESLPAFLKKQKQDKGDEFGRRCFISAVAGSFYGRLFPEKTLHFVHSSSSLHWLSQVPAGVVERNDTNKGKIYISKSSPQCVVDAYASQFQDDFSLFLRSRAAEVVCRGRMVLTLMGRSSIDPTSDESCYQWELLAQALMTLVKEGLIEEEKVDSFNAPFYAPCPEEVETVIQREGSFIIDGLEAFETEWDGGTETTTDGDAEAATLLKRESRGQRVAKTARAIVEPMLASHFGKSIMDRLFTTYAHVVDNYLSDHSTNYIHLVISIISKDM